MESFPLAIAPKPNEVLSVDSEPIGDSPSKNDWNSDEPITEAISERLLALRLERFNVPSVLAKRRALLGPEDRFKFGAVISVVALPRTIWFVLVVLAPKPMAVEPS